MPKGPAARLGDTTAHGCPLVPGPGSPTVFIGGKPAWRGLGPAGVAAIAAAVSDAMTKIMKAQAAATAAQGTVAGPAAQANLVKTTAEQVANVASAMLNTGADNMACTVVKVVIPDGPGLVTTPSSTVMIGGFPACRVGDTITEVTAVNSIAMGCPTVIIGG